MNTETSGQSDLEFVGAFRVLICRYRFAFFLLMRAGLAIPMLLLRFLDQPVKGHAMYGGCRLVVWLTVERVRGWVPGFLLDGLDESAKMNESLQSLKELFPEGTPVRVLQTTRRRDASYEAESVGVVQAWETLATGSWFAHGKNDKLWLTRLRLRKADGEITLLVIDDATSIAKLEAVSG